MSQKNWTKEEINEVKTLTESGHTISQIATKMKRTFQSVSSAKRRYRIVSPCSESFGTLVRTINKDNLIDEYNLHTERQKIWHTFNEIKKPFKIIPICDTHIPFHRSDIIDFALSLKPDIVVLSEVLDFYSLSVFRKNQLIPLKQELAEGLKLIEKIKNKVKYIVMGNCNHQQRFMKTILDRLKEYPEIIEILGNQDPFQDIAKQKGVLTTNGWWCQIGDIIFCHPDWFSNVNLRTVQNSHDYFIGDLPQFHQHDFRTIINFHTHHIGFTPFRNKILMEGGCCSHRMDYLYAGKKRIETHAGFWELYLDRDGKLDFNKSKPYLFETK